MKKNVESKFWVRLMAILLTIIMILPSPSFVIAEQLPDDPTETNEVQLNQEGENPNVLSDNETEGNSESSEESPLVDEQADVLPSPNSDDSEAATKEEPTIEEVTPSDDKQSDNEQETTNNSDTSEDELEETITYKTTTSRQAKASFEKIPSDEKNKTEGTGSNEDDIVAPSLDPKMEAVSTTENILGDVIANMFNASADGNGTAANMPEQFPYDRHEREWYGDSPRLRDATGGNFVVYRDTFLLFSQEESKSYEVLWSKDGSKAYVSPAIQEESLKGKTGIVFLSEDLSKDTIIVFDGAPKYEGDTMEIPVMDTSLISLSRLFSDGRLKYSSSDMQKQNTRKGGVGRPIIPTVDWETSPSGTNWTGELSNFGLKDFYVDWDIDIMELGFELIFHYGAYCDFDLTSTGPTAPPDKEPECVTVGEIGIPINAYVTIGMAYQLKVKFDDTPMNVKGTVEAEMDYTLGMAGAQIHNYKTDVTLKSLEPQVEGVENKEIDFFIGSAFRIDAKFLELKVEIMGYEVTIGPIVDLDQLSTGGNYYQATLHKNEYEEPDKTQNSIHICSKNGEEGCWDIPWYEWQTEDIDLTIDIYIASKTFNIHDSGKEVSSGNLYDSLTFKSGLKPGYCPHIYYRIPVSVWEDDDMTKPAGGIDVNAENPGEERPEYAKDTTATGGDELGRANVFVPWRESYKYTIDAKGKVGDVPMAGSATQPSDIVRDKNDRVNIILKPNTLVDAKVTKVWDTDIDGKDVPEKIRVVLEQEMTAETGQKYWGIIDTATLNADNGWSHVFEGSRYTLKEYETDDQGNPTLVKYHILELGEGTDAHVWPDPNKEYSDYEYGSDDWIDALNFIRNNYVNDGDKTKYTVPQYETSQGTVVQKHKTLYLAGYETTQTKSKGSQNGLIDTTVTNTALMNVDINKTWSPSDMEKPGNVYVALLYSPEDEWASKAKEEGITEAWIPVLEPVAGNANTLNDLIDAEILETDDPGEAGTVPLAIAKIDEGAGWKTSFTVPKYRSGIPMKFMGAELDSQIIEDLLKNEYHKTQEAEVKSFGDFTSVSGAAYKTGDDWHLAATVLNTDIPAISGNVIWRTTETSVKPDKVTITVLDKDNKKVTSFEVEPPDEDQDADTWPWIYKSEGLDPKAKYTVKEDIPPGSDPDKYWFAEIQGLNAINHWIENQPVKARIRALFELGVEETPDKIDVSFYPPEGSPKYKILEKSGGYVVEFDISGVKDYTGYTIEETSGVDNFVPVYKDMTVTVEDGVPYYNFTVLNKAQATMTITLNKKWDHGDPSDVGVLPSEVTVDVYRDGDLIATEIVSEPNWQRVIDRETGFDDMRFDRVAQDGHLYSYTVKEHEVEGYATFVSKESSLHTATFNITNTRKESYHVTVKGTVNWKGDEEKEDLRPKTVYINILNQDKENIASVRVPVDEDGTWEVRGLPGVDEDGNRIRYYAREDHVDGYVTTYADVIYDENMHTYTCDLTNYLAGYFSFTVKKVIQGTPGPDDKDAEFTFKVEPYNIEYDKENSENGTEKTIKEMPAPVEPVLTITGEGEATENLMLDRQGVYVYTVTEVKGDKNYAYDENKWAIMIVVIPDRSGKPEYKSWTWRVVSDSEPTPEESDTITFVNKVNQKITYDLNGGEFDGSTDDIIEEYTAGSMIKIHEAPTREGYTFLYWKGSEYQPGDAYAVTEDHTFVAQWKKNDDPKPTPTPAPQPTPAPTPDNPTPNTGDESALGFYELLLALSIMGSLGVWVIGRRMRER